MANVDPASNVENGAASSGDITAIEAAWKGASSGPISGAWAKIGTSYTFKWWFLALCALLVLSDWQPNLAGKGAMLIFIAVAIRVLVQRK